MVLALCLVILGIAGALTIYRMTIGPTMLDRVVAMDVLVAIVVCGLGVEAAFHRHTTTLPILVVLSLVGFVGSVSVARFAARDRA
jgi:multicomponent Na+:H+ antiporter subunit F